MAVQSPLGAASEGGPDRSASAAVGRDDRKFAQEPSRSAVRALLQRRGTAEHTVLDLDYRHSFWSSPAEASAEIGPAIDDVTVAVGNRAECDIAVGTSDPDTVADRLLERGVKLAVVKMGADGVIVGAAEPWDGAVCSRLPRLKVVARSGIGYDNVEVAACAAAGVAACNTPDAPTVSAAEHSLALLLAVSKRIKRSELRLHAGLGDYRAVHCALELEGRTLGLVGCGRIGRRVARYAAALGMRVLVHDPHLEAPDTEGVAELVDLDELWRRSDAVSLHAPATEATRRMVDADSIAAMRPGVIIVNCARGSLIDHEALLAGLESGHVAGAGLDVTDPEPLPAGHPLLGRDDVVVTPHVASFTTAGAVRLLGQALGQAVQWLRGEMPEHLLDAAAADPAVDRRRAS